MSPDPQPPSRIRSVDALRGLVMIIMAIDHTREFFHAGAMTFQPEDLSRTTAAVFLTRWITHICAPVFMFTAGIGAFFWLRRGRTKGQLSRFLLTRGLWLIVLDVTVLRLALNFSLTSGLVILNVLWALGWSMVVLAALVHLPIRVLTVVSIAVIALHNLLDPVPVSFFGSAAPLWNLLHQPGLLGGVVLVAYTLVPWFAVMAAGFCFGRIMTRENAGRNRMLIALGLALTIGFFVVRGLNIYGDPQPWTTQFPGKTALSFLRATKYPPSLSFLLMTLGPAILLLAWFDRRTWTLPNPLVVFGRVPLFFFLAHILLIHLLTIPFALARYGEAGFLRHVMPTLGGDAKLYPPNFGYDLWVVYVVWAVVVLLLYPACLWFARLKERRRDAWLSYL